MSANGSTISLADMDATAGLAPEAGVTRTLWVSAGAAAGGDGSADHPFASIQAAVTAATAGTAVMVKAGTYIENVKIPSNSGGTTDHPVQLISADGQGAAKIIAADNSLAVIKGLGVHDIVVKGFELQGGVNGLQFCQSGLDFTHMVSNVLIQGNIVANTLEDGIKVSQADKIRVLDNTVAHTGQEGIDFLAVNDSVIARNDVSFVAGAAGVFAKGGSTNVLITANLIHDITKDGIELGGWTASMYFRPGYNTYEASHLTVIGNVVSNVGQRAVNVQGAIDSVMTGNLLHANAAYYTAIGVGSGYNKAMLTHDLDIYNNQVTDYKTLISIDAGNGAGVSQHDNAALLSGLTSGPGALFQVATIPAALAVLQVSSGAFSSATTVDGAVTLTGTARSETIVGAAAHNDLHGMAGNDLLVGGAGSDTLEGGDGSDTMVGGAGDDLYYVANTGDKVVELEGGGTDTIVTSLTSLKLSAFANVENVVYFGAGKVGFAGNDLANLLVGGALADTLDGGAGANTLVGGTGDDLYLVRDSRDLVVERAGEGIDTVRSDASFVLADNVENLVLTRAGLTAVGNALDNRISGADGGDELSGGAGDDTLQGGNGADTLNGGVGADSLSGGLGDDVYFVDDARDAVFEAANGGHDTLYTTLSSYTLTGTGVEDLKVAGDEPAALTGNPLANLLVGGGGNDTLDGGRGADTLQGGDGDDAYAVDDLGDKVIEATRGGFDTVVVSVSGWAADAGQEIEKFVAAPGTNAIALKGNELANLLVGNAAANTLDGGAGADTLQGGDGNDSYVVDALGDEVVEATSGGIDTVNVSVSGWTPDAGQEIEKIVAAVGTAPLALNGNEFANLLVGNAGANTLDGGAGADTLQGGAGDDNYVVSDLADKVVEAAAGGYDTVTVSVGGWTPEAGQEIEKIAAAAGSAPIALKGNDLANLLVGNAGANTLDGGAGADTLQGGAGDDAYAVNDLGDKVIEAAGGGNDVVTVSVSGWTPDAGQEIEKIAAIAGTSPMALKGNDFVNLLVGNAGNNALDGGAGADTLQGGAGDDAYAIDNLGDKVVEAVGGGNDTVTVSVSGWTADAGQEIEKIVAAAGSAPIVLHGNEFANLLVGNAGANLLDGGAGADTFQGGGGEDSFQGGDGDDTFYIDSLGDRVVEATKGGYDTAVVSVSGWTPEAGQEIEKIAAAAGADPIALHGNEFANLLVGNAGANLLDGGAGGDTLQGGAGDDVYAVDNVGDKVIENKGEGSDLVKASVSFTLGANVENLALTTAGLTAKGNELANVIIGSSGADTLIGAAGADTLTGGLGADAFTFQHLSDKGDVITDFQVGVDKLNVHAMLAEFGTAAHLSFEPVQGGLDVFVDYSGHHELLALLQGVSGSSLATSDYIV